MSGNLSFRDEKAAVGETLFPFGANQCRRWFHTIVSRGETLKIHLQNNEKHFKPCSKTGSWILLGRKQTSICLKLTLSYSNQVGRTKSSCILMFSTFSPHLHLLSELFHFQMNGQLFGGLSVADWNTFDLFLLLTHWHSGSLDCLLPMMNAPQTGVLTWDKPTLDANDYRYSLEAGGGGEAAGLCGPGKLQGEPQIESLILLSEYMCWDWADTIFLLLCKLNFGCLSELKSRSGFLTWQNDGRKREEGSSIQTCSTQQMTNASRCIILWYVPCVS